MDSYCNTYRNNLKRIEQIKSKGRYCIMKQKYTITVAGMEINIVTDQSPETVDNIVSTIDRRIREINLRSPLCSRTESALLCAMDYCADKLKAQRKVKCLEALNAEYEFRISELEDEIEALKKKNG